MNSLDIELFHADLMNSVHLAVASSGGFTDDAFAEAAAERLIESNEIATYEPCSYRTPSGRMAIDGYCFDEADDSLRVFIVYRKGTDALGTVTRTEAETQFRKLVAFVRAALTGQFENSVDENHPARDFAERVFQNKTRISHIHAYLLSDALLSARVKDWPQGSIDGIPVDFRIWDIGRFFRAYVSSTGLDDIVVDFCDNPFGDDDGLPCLVASTPGSPYEAYLCVLPAELLGYIYGKYGSRLLEGNVRAFLTAKGKINQGIRSTLLKLPQMFFAYNNGISAVASDVRVENTANGPRMVSATNLQIVNGGQTTASIENVQRMDKATTLSQAFVPMKLSKVTGDRASTMIEDISKYANSQNKVSDADFFASHPFHRRIEQFSRRIWAPARGGNQYVTHWYYERARGQYLNEFARLTKSQRDHLRLEIPKDQLITKTDLARCELSWDCRPFNVSAGAQVVIGEFARRISEKWRVDPDSFNEDYFRRIVARMLIYRHAGNCVSQQSWYIVGYRAIIVAYAIARLSHELATRKCGVLDLKRVWQQQDIYSELSQQLIDIAKAVFESMNQPDDSQRNLTQWAKRQGCWEEVKRVPVALSSAFLATLINADEIVEEEKAARSLQHLDSGIGDQEQVLSLGPRFWNDLLNWARCRNGLAESDERVLRAAAGEYGNLPSEKQCKRLLQLKMRYEDQGFVQAQPVDVP